MEGWSEELSILVYSSPYKFLFVVILCMLTCSVLCHKNILIGGLQKTCKVYHLGKQFSDVLGSCALTVGPSDLEGLLQPKLLKDSDFGNELQCTLTDLLFLWYNIEGLINACLINACKPQLARCLLIYGNKTKQHAKPTEYSSNLLFSVKGHLKLTSLSKVFWAIGFWPIGFWSQD